MKVECKWSSKPVGSDIFANLERKVSLVQAELAGRRISYGLCSRAGFTSQVLDVAQQREDVVLFDLPAIGDSFTENAAHRRRSLPAWEPMEG